MSKISLSQSKSPWLFMLLFLIAFIICQVLVIMLLVVAFQMPMEERTTRFWVTVLSWALLLFIVVPYLLKFHDRLCPYTAYLSEIRLTHLKPVLKLVILGISCYIFVAVSDVAATLIYRISQGLEINQAFIKTAFPLTSEFPPNSWGFVFSMPSIFEEIAFRGVILTLFLRFYPKTKAIIFSALTFGAYHLLGIISGLDPAWAAGAAFWAAFLGLFYGYVVLKTNSLIPAMIVHYLSNLFIYPFTAYLQENAAMQTQIIYGIILTMGIIPTVLMVLWTRFFSTKWPFSAET